MDMIIKNNDLAYLGERMAECVRDDVKRLETWITRARVKKDGFFYKYDYQRISYNITYMFTGVSDYFITDDTVLEERDTLRRMLDTLPAEQFKAFANIMLEPYKNINPIENV